MLTRCSLNFWRSYRFVFSVPRYTPTTCFETFPFPESSAEQAERIAEAAWELDRLRTGWLNPPEWTREEVLEFPGSAREFATSTTLTRAASARFATRY